MTGERRCEGISKEGRTPTTGVRSRRGTFGVLLRERESARPKRKEVMLNSQNDIYVVTNSDGSVNEVLSTRPTWNLVAEGQTLWLAGLDGGDAIRVPDPPKTNGTMRGNIRQTEGDEGGIEIVANVGGTDTVLTRITGFSMRYLYEQCMEDPDGEADYCELSDAIVEQMADQMKDNRLCLSLRFRDAVYQAIAPGAAYDNPITFSV